MTFSRWIANSLKKEKQVLGRLEKAHHFSSKLLIIDALITTALTVGIISLTANGQSSATTSQLINIGAVELTAPQLITHMHSDTSDGHVFWLGDQFGFMYTVDGAIWGTHWIEYHQKGAIASNDVLAGVRVCTFANADFFAAHLEPLQASLLTAVTTPKGRHAAFDPEKLDEVVVHFPGETAVTEIYFPGKETIQTLISATDSLVYFE